MKFIFFGLVLLIQFDFICAQQNYAMMHHPFLQTEASNVFPSILGKDFRKGQFNLLFPFFDIHLGVTNNAINYGKFLDLTNTETLTDEALSGIINGLRDRNSFNADLNANLIRLAFNSRDSASGRLRFAMGFDIQEQFTANMQLSRNVIKLLYEGNKQFENQLTDLGPIEVNALYYRNYGITIAIPLIKQSKGLITEVVVGARLSFLQGLGNVYTKSGNVSMFTAEDGRYIDFDYDYEFSSTIPGETIDILRGLGYGGSVDISTTVELFDQLRLSLAINNLGAIRFSDSTVTRFNGDNFRYDGANLELLSDGVNDVFDLDSLESILDYEENSNPYTVPLNQMINLQAQYGLQPGVDKFDNAYFKHYFSSLINIGFKNYLSSSTIPTISIAYHYNLNNTFIVGPVLTAGGNRNFALGGNIGLGGKHIKFNIYSDDFLPFIYRRAGYGSTAGINLSIRW